MLWLRRFCAAAGEIAAKASALLAFYPWADSESVSSARGDSDSHTVTSKVSSASSDSHSATRLLRLTLCRLHKEHALLAVLQSGC